VTRWLWIWFLAFAAFPVALPARNLVVPASSSGAAPPKAPAWGGPLAGVLDHLEWVGGRKATGADLAGHIVLVEYWASECINCRRSLPAMRELDRRFSGSEVRLISIHTPELPVERNAAHVAEVVKRDSLGYPVALDPDYAAWEAIGNRYWPCLYVLDRAGKVRYTHIGELHQGSPGWDDLLKRIELLRASSS
jgi:thiol-disulfide isomerase/thioredoxin